MILRCLQRTFAKQLNPYPSLFQFSNNRGFKKFDKKNINRKNENNQNKFQSDNDMNEKKEETPHDEAKLNMNQDKEKNEGEGIKGFEKFSMKKNVSEKMKFGKGFDKFSVRRKEKPNDEAKLNIKQDKEIDEEQEMKKETNKFHMKKEDEQKIFQQKLQSQKEQAQIKKNQNVEQNEKKEKLSVGKGFKLIKMKRKSQQGIKFLKRRNRKKNQLNQQEKQEEQAQKEKRKKQFFDKQLEDYKQFRRLNDKKNVLLQTLFFGYDFKTLKNNPAFYSAFLFVERFKFLPIVLLLFVLWKIFGDREISEEVEPQFIFEALKRGEAKDFRFVKQIKETGFENSKMTKELLQMNTIDGKRYVCLSNKDFKNLLFQKIAEQEKQQRKIFVTQKIKDTTSPIVNLRSFLIMGFFFYLFQSFRRKRPQQGKNNENPLNIFGKSKSKKVQQKNIKVKFHDVMGMQKAKEQIVEFIDFLINPKKYNRLGARIPKGALLTGPPGTGKTMIAKACAGESNSPFFAISGSEFMEMYVGVGAQRVRDLFKQAKQNSPSIIFIDEIDAIGKKRSSGLGGGNDERDTTLNQLLVEMDGFGTETNVIVFAATNQKEVLDPALTRPGRFDRLIEVDLPDIQGRKQIFMVHLKPITLESDKKIEEYARRMATLTPGFSGADIKNLCNEAAIIAARDQKLFVSLHDFQLATERIIGGVEKKSNLITPETRKTVAYHECGHGVASWFMEGANPLLKLTIIPRSKGALGFAQYLPNENQISSLKQLEDQICVILGGRISEQIFFQKISTGAYDDLQKAYKLAKAIVAQFGMNKKLGWLSFDETEYAKYYSHKIQKQIDEEIMKIIARCTKRTRDLLMQKRELIENLAQKLLEKETIDQTTITSILGERPFKPTKQYEEYLREKQRGSYENEEVI